MTRTATHPRPIFPIGCLLLSGEAGILQDAPRRRSLPESFEHLQRQECLQSPAWPAPFDHDTCHTRLLQRDFPAGVSRHEEPEQLAEKGGVADEQHAVLRASFQLRQDGLRIAAGFQRPRLPDAGRQPERFRDRLGRMERPPIGGRQDERDPGPELREPPSHAVGLPVTLGRQVPVFVAAGSRTTLGLGMPQQPEIHEDSVAFNPASIQNPKSFYSSPAMPLSAGDQLGPYEIVGPLGSGGMGDVYRARDNRLRREVALKMLAEAAVNDTESLARFDRETHAVASLNHPNILAIHDSGSHNGVPYAVTELLEGETLADRLRSGSLAPPRATEIACQVAEGRAKILDFGIARIEKLQTLSPSRASQKSSSAMLIGTAGYVSPEQVRGKRADARSDIFSLGAVFYEMLTGRRAFVRDSPVETLGAVLRDDPRKSPDAEKIPPKLAPFVFRCLEKDPADRYQAARDVLIDLRSWQAELTQESAARVKFRSVPPWQQRRSRIYLRAVGGALLFVLGLFAGSCWERNRWKMSTTPAGHTNQPVPPR